MVVFPKREKIAKRNEYPESVLGALDAFYIIVSRVNWQSLQEIKQTFPTAEILKDGRVIFDIDNQYHLVVKINLQYKAIHVQFFEPYGKLTQILKNTSYYKKN